MNSTVLKQTNELVVDSQRQMEIGEESVGEMNHNGKKTRSDTFTTREWNILLMQGRLCHLKFFKACQTSAASILVLKI